MSLPSVLVVCSAAIVFTLGLLHLVYTFVGPRLLPRDRELRERMDAVSLVITKETTVWRAWIGFNASHSFGALFFGALYGYFALAQPVLLFGSVYLASIGGLLLVGYIVLAAKYWFRVPFRGVVLATVCYAAAFVLA